MWSDPSPDPAQAGTYVHWALPRTLPKVLIVFKSELLKHMFDVCNYRIVLVYRHVVHKPGSYVHNVSRKRKKPELYEKTRPAGGSELYEIHCLIRGPYL